VVAALGVFDYMEDPEKLLLRMMELSSGKVVGSFPGYSMLRAPLRKVRYTLKGCPVHFYTRARIERLCQNCGLRDFVIQPCASQGFMLIGRLRAASTDVARAQAVQGVT